MRRVSIAYSFSWIQACSSGTTSRCPQWCNQEMSDSPHNISKCWRQKPICHFWWSRIRCFGTHITHTLLYTKWWWIMVWTVPLLRLSLWLISLVIFLQLTWKISLLEAMESLVITLFLLDVVSADLMSFAAFHWNFYTICSQPYDLNSGRHTLSPFFDRCLHYAHLLQPETVLTRVVLIWRHPWIARLSFHTI